MHLLRRLRYARAILATSFNRTIDWISFGKSAPAAKTLTQVHYFPRLAELFGVVQCSLLLSYNERSTPSNLLREDGLAVTPHCTETKVVLKCFWNTEVAQVEPAQIKRDQIHPLHSVLNISHK